MTTPPTPNMLLNHTDLYHVFLHVEDVEGSMARLGEQFGLTWLPIRTGLQWVWAPGDEPRQERYTTVYSRQGPVHLELGWFPIGPMREPTGLQTPHHFGYWCADVAGTREGLLADGWVVEFEAGPTGEAPTSPYLRSPSGYLVELVPKSRQDAFCEFLAG
ncbi:MAG: VOC family protein [Candidatus Limnocylindria bacterium]